MSAYVIKSLYCKQLDPRIKVHNVCFYDKNFGKRGITEMLGNGQQPFLYATHRLYLIHIPIYLHEDIPSSYRGMECTSM